MENHQYGWNVESRVYTASYGHRHAYVYTYKECYVYTCGYPAHSISLMLGIITFERVNVKVKDTT